MAVRYVGIDGIDLAWLAGWLEGEGCFFVAPRGKHSLQISISGCSTDEDTMRKVHKIAGGNLGGPYSVGTPDKGWKQQWRWSINSRKESIALMKKLRPMMSQRRQIQIDNCIEFEAATPDRKFGRTCGTYSAYGGGCRCDKCRQANTEYWRKMRRKKEELAA